MHDRGYSVHTWNVLMIAFQVPSQFDTILKHVVPETQEGLHDIRLLHSIRRQPIRRL